MDANDRGLVQFTALAHALFHTYELSIPLFVGLWMAEFGVSAAVIGAVVGAGYGLVGIGALPSGILADRLASRRLILLSVVGMGVGFLLVSLARGVVTLGVAVVVWGAFASLYHPCGLSLISRSADARGTVFAYHGAGGNVGTDAGPLVTALLLLAVEWRVAVALLALPAFAAALIGSRIQFESVTAEDVGEVADEDVGEPASASDEGPSNGERNDTSPKGSEGTLLDDVRRTVADTRSLFGLGFSVAFVAVLLYGTYYRGLLTFLPDVLAGSTALAPIEVLGREVNPSQYVYSALLTVGIGGQYAGGRLTDRLPSTTAFTGSLIVLVALALLFPVASSAGVVPLVAVSLALGFFVYGTAPIYQVVIAEQAADDVHGLSYGYTYLAMFGIGALGASMAGAALTYATSATLFVALATIAAAGVGCAVLLRRLSSGRSSD
ncbi:MAG: MFS transporter [Halopenitus sp.]